MAGQRILVHVGKLGIETRSVRGGRRKEKNAKKKNRKGVEQGFCLLASGKKSVSFLNSHPQMN